jgi:hypothetical protein
MFKGSGRVGGRDKYQEVVKQVTDENIKYFVPENIFERCKVTYFILV